MVIQGITQNAGNSMISTFITALNFIPNFRISLEMQTLLDISSSDFGISDLFNYLPILVVTI